MAVEFCSGFHGHAQQNPASAGFFHGFGIDKTGKN
jgi:hypothetical protein